MRVLAPTPILCATGLLLLAGCASSDAPEHRFIDDFLARSEPARCEPVLVLNALRAQVEDVATAGDSAVVALLAHERRVVIYRPDLAAVRSVRFAREGPTGVEAPVSATLAGDSLLYVADRARHALVRLDLDGRDRGRIRLRFPPQQVRAAGGRVVVAPLVLGDEPPRLLYTLDDAEPRPVAIAPLRYDDITATALANVLLAAPLRDGGTVAMHRMLVPVAYRVDPEGAVRRLAVPLPDGVRSTLGYVPRTPITDDELDALTMAGIAMAPDHATGDLLYITRSGERRRAPSAEGAGAGDEGARGAPARAPGGGTAARDDGWHRKAIIRVDARFRYRRSYLLDANVIHLAYLSGPERSFVADEGGRWLRCHTP